MQQSAGWNIPLHILPSHEKGDNVKPDLTVYEDHAIKVLCFRPRVSGELSTLTLPPQAGHGAQIAYWPAPGQNLMETVLDSTRGGVYLVKWKSCTHERRNESYADLAGQVGVAIGVTGGDPVRLIGLCQGGTLASIYAALHPHDVARLIVAGAPIDVSVGESVLKQAMNAPFWMYRMVVSNGGGMVSGHWLGTQWKASDWRKHYVDRYTCPDDKTEAFYAWYDDTRNLAGGWYLELIKGLFLNNDLANDRFTVGGRTVNLANITCPTDLIGGSKDDITPRESLFAMAEHVPHARQHVATGGHIGLFMGREAMTTWNETLRGNA